VLSGGSARTERPVQRRDKSSSEEATTIVFVISYWALVNASSLRHIILDMFSDY
jgi:hypothetical protein